MVWHRTVHGWTHSYLYCSCSATKLEKQRYSLGEPALHLYKNAPAFDKQLEQGHKMQGHFCNGAELALSRSSTAFQVL
jgi:hypothetical protein